MSLERVKTYLKKYNKEAEIIEFNESTATVEEAARTLNVTNGEIAKTLSFSLTDKYILIVTAGDYKIDNKKYKEKFGQKAQMISREEVEKIIGHDVGGVCPFGINEGIEVYLDESLKKYDYIYPACGTSNSAIKLTVEELYNISNATEFIDVCKVIE
ncbi:MAG: YbaK/EbsC family protein [Bacilli bacterium]|nr:YbaK/EbsC family protein [Bacilli bacterium]